MALSLYVDTPDVLEVDEYVEYVTNQVDIFDLESVAASAGKFRALMNNPKLITGILNRQLDDWGTFQEGNSYTAQTFILAIGPEFFIRANIWTPPAKNEEIGSAEARNFSYLIPHDHNFTFMTGGYFGSGYRTTIWEYEHGKVEGIRGEPVDLHLLERTSLPSGKIMIYRKSIDVHSQEHADEFSISLNLMILPRETALDTTKQIIFDVERGTVQSASSSNAGRIPVCELAQYVGDSTTAGLLDSLSTKHADPQVRAVSIRSLVNMLPHEAAGVYERATRDADPMVRRLAVAGLESGEFAEAAYQSARIGLGTS